MTAPVINTLNTQPLSPAVEKATIAKLTAEAKHITANTELVRREIDATHITIASGEAELRADIAHANEAEYNAEVARMGMELNRRNEKIVLASDHHARVLNFAAPVDDKNVEKALQQLAIWHRTDETSDMNITMFSGGGSAMAGLNLFDQLTAYSIRGKGTHKVTITVRGYAASMAAILLQAADVRVIGPESYLMIHEVSSGAQGKIGELKTEVKFLEHMGSRIADIFVERSGGAIDLETFEAKWKSQDWWLDSAQAKSFGFVDRIG